eukprot:45115-Eustigmatos_ZCMA.PRE.1
MSGIWSNSGAAHFSMIKGSYSWCEDDTPQSCGLVIGDDIEFGRRCLPPVTLSALLLRCQGVPLIVPE